MRTPSVHISEPFKKDRVQLVRIAYVEYGHPNLDEAEAFAKDFGLIPTNSKSNSPDVPTKYFRGYGELPLSWVAVQTEEPQFLGVTFEVQTMADLEKAARIPGASAIENVDHQPGGGFRVTIQGPDGIPFHLICGQTLVPRQEPPQQVDAYNYPASSDDNLFLKPRRGVMQRPQKGPSPVHKLGHCGYVVSNLTTALEFYVTHFSFAESDRVKDPFTEGDSHLIFLHIDKGNVFTDHHSFFLATPMGKQTPGVHHAAFEVHNFDIQLLAHDFMKKKGYKLRWGVGRHGPGSQIFDYWFDLNGFVVEHYSDGDLVNEDTTFRDWDVQEANTWGPHPPPLDE